MSLDRQRVRSGPIRFYTGAKDLVRGQFWLFVGITLLASFIGTAVPLYPLLGAVAYGVYLALRTKERGHEARLDMLFKGFDKLGETVVPSLAYGAAVIASILVVMLPAAMILVDLSERGQEDKEMVVMGGSYVLMGLACVLSWMPFTFAFQLVLDRELSGMAAVGESWRATCENFFTVFVVNLLAVLLYVLGIAACCLGWILVLPLIVGAQWLMYREIYPDLGLGEDAERWARENRVVPEPPPRRDWSSESAD